MPWQLSGNGRSGWSTKLIRGLKAEAAAGFQSRRERCREPTPVTPQYAAFPTYKAGSVHNQTMNMLPNEPTQERIDHIGGVIGKVIVIALAAFFLWGYSTTFLAQVGLFF